MSELESKFILDQPEEEIIRKAHGAETGKSSGYRAFYPYYPLSASREIRLITRDSIELTDRFIVTRNEQLGYTHYILGEEDEAGKGNILSFEMFLSDEVRALVKTQGWKKIRNLLMSEFGNIEKTPYGESSLDPDKGDKKAQKFRTINQITQGFEDEIGLPVAVKGTGSTTFDDANREDLMRQYVLMRELSVMSQSKFSEGQKKVLEFCPVYAAIKHKAQGPKRFQEWLFMKKISGASRVTDINTNEDKTIFGGPPDWGMAREDAKPLNEAFGIPDRDLGFGYFNIVLFNDFNLKFDDLAGRNMLKTDQDGQVKFTIIDPKRSW